MTPNTLVEKVLKITYGGSEVPDPSTPTERELWKQGLIRKKEQAQEIIDLVLGSQWISVEDGLPDHQEPVLVICAGDVNDYAHPYTNEQAMLIGFRSSDKWWCEQWPENEPEDNVIEDVTHWTPLPSFSLPLPETP